MPEPQPEPRPDAQPGAQQAPGSGPLRDIATLAGHSDRMTCVDFAPARNDRLLSAGKDGAVAIWTIKGEESADADLVRHDAPIRFAEFWPDGDGLVFGSDDGTARLVDLEAGEETGRYTTVEAMKPGASQPTGFAKSVSDTAKAAGAIVAALIPLGAIIAAASNQASTASPVQHAAADATLERIAVLTLDQKVTLYDLVTGEVARRWSLATDSHSSLAFAGGSLIVATPSKLLVMSEDADKPDAAIRLSKASIRGMLRMGQDRIATFDASKTLTIWNATRRAIESAFKAPKQPTHACMLGSDRVLIVDGSRRVAALPIAARVDTPWHEIDGGKIRAIASSDDGTRFAVASDDLRVRVFHAPI